MAWFCKSKSNGFAIYRLKSLVCSVLFLTYIILHNQVSADNAGKTPVLAWQKVATFSSKSTLQAVAINADESLIATATAGKKSTHIQLYDRPSQALLGSIKTQVGSNVTLRFAPSRDLLLVTGTKALALWEVSLANLRSNKTLPERFRLWRMPMHQTQGPVGTAAFTASAGMVVWSQKHKLYKRSTQAGKNAGQKPFYKSHTGNITNLNPRLDVKTPLVLVQTNEEKHLVQTPVQENAPSIRLSGHRFPVVAAWFGTQEKLSLDRSFTLIRWRENLIPDPAKVLSHLDKKFAPIHIQPIANDGLVLLGKSENSHGEMVFLSQTGRVQAKRIRANSVQLLAISPSSSYVLVGKEKHATLLLLNQQPSPLRYLTRLRTLGSTELARSYVRHLDERIATATQKKRWLNGLEAKTQRMSLQGLKRILRGHLNGGDFSAAQKTASEILQLQPNQPEALAALKAIRLRQEKATLTQAAELTKTGKPREALKLLTQKLTLDSLLPKQIKKGIAQAEEKINQDLILEQVQEKLHMGDDFSAKALLAEVLTQDKQNSQALALQQQLQFQKRRSWRDWIAVVLGALLALAMGIGYYGWRRRHGHDPGGTPPPGEGVKGLRKGAFQSTKNLFSRVTPKTDPIRVQVVRNLLESLQERIEQGLFEKNNKQRQLRGTWLQWQAELNALSHVLSHQPESIGQIHQRLKMIEQQLQRLSTVTTVKNSTGSGHGVSANTQRSAQQTKQKQGNSKARDWKRDRETKEQPQSRVSKQQMGSQRTVQNTPMEGLSHYEILQVAFTAGPDEVKKAYHRLLKQYHPDHHVQSKYPWVYEEAERMSRRISEAYQVLIDLKKRADYDLVLHQKGLTPRQRFR